MAGRRGRGGAGLPVDAAGGHRADGPADRRRARGRGGRARVHQRPRRGEPAAPGRASAASATSCCGLLRGPVLALCVGPVTAPPLEAAGRAHGAAGTVPARGAGAPAGGRAAGAGAQPARRRAPARDPRARRRSSTATCGVLPPNGMTLLQALARRPGWVVAAGRAAARAARAGATTSTPSRRRWPGCVRRWAPEADPDGGQARLPAGAGPGRGPGAGGRALPARRRRVTRPRARSSSGRSVVPCGFN